MAGSVHCAVVRHIIIIFKYLYIILLFLYNFFSSSRFQALIGSVAYDTAIEKDSSEQHKVWGMQILTIAVLCILITAPVGAAGMSIAGPRLLQMTKKTDDR